MCLLYVGDNVPRAPHARGHMHVPFYEGTCQNLLGATGETLEQLQSGIMMASDDRIDSNFWRARGVAEAIPMRSNVRVSE